jgi:hypothetical protein
VAGFWTSTRLSGPQGRRGCEFPLKNLVSPPIDQGKPFRSTSITNSTQIDDADSSGVVSYTPSGSWGDTDATISAGAYHQNTVQ